MSTGASLTREQRRYFRNDLRAARASILEDSEAYAEPLQSLERLGRFLKPNAFDLGKVANALCELAAESPLADELPARWPAFHRPFRKLFYTVKDYRNDVMHVGARARHLTTHAVEVCLVLEDAMQNGLSSIADFMVTDLVAVERWQPVSLLRQQMLKHSFTYIPVAPPVDSDEWFLIADHQLARYIDVRTGRLDRLAVPIGRALDSGLQASPAQTIPSSATIEQARHELSSQPFLVEEEGRIVGIVTAFDLL